MKIGVSGASGKLGAAVLRELKANVGKHSLVAVSRSPENLDPGVEARYGDYDKPESLTSAYEGLDRVLLIPSADLAPGVRGVQLTAAIDAAVTAGVEHIFLMSAAGTRSVPETTLGGSYWTGEQHLIRIAASWTILRMNYYAESMVEEILMSEAQGVLAGFGEERVAYGSREDMALAAAHALISEGHEGAIYNTTGPAALTGPERATIASDILSKPLTYMVLPEDVLKGGLTQAGLPPVVVDAVVEIKNTFVLGHFDIVTGDIEILSGRKPKSFREVFVAMTQPSEPPHAS